MNRQSGMSLLEVLLALSIFAAVALTLVSSMQGQTNAIARMRDETLALWIADNQLQAQNTFTLDDKSITGEESLLQQEWTWRRETHKTTEENIIGLTATVTLPNGRQVSLTRYRFLADASGQGQK